MFHFYCFFGFTVHWESFFFLGTNCEYYSNLKTSVSLTLCNHTPEDCLPGKH